MADTYDEQLAAELGRLSDSSITTDAQLVSRVETQGCPDAPMALETALKESRISDFDDDNNDLDPLKKSAHSKKRRSTPSEGGISTMKISYPWPLRSVENLPAIGAEILEFPAPGLEPTRVALLYDEDCDFRLRAAAAVLYRSGLLPSAAVLAETKGNLWVALKQPATWPEEVVIAGDVWGVVPTDDLMTLANRESVVVTSLAAIRRIQERWPSRDEAAAMLRRLYRI